LTDTTEIKKLNIYFILLKTRNVPQICLWQITCTTLIQR